MFFLVNFSLRRACDSERNWASLHRRIPPPCLAWRVGRNVGQEFLSSCFSSRGKKIASCRCVPSAIERGVTGRSVVDQRGGTRSAPYAVHPEPHRSSLQMFSDSFDSRPSALKHTGKSLRHRSHTDNYIAPPPPSPTPPPSSPPLPPFLPPPPRTPPPPSPRVPTPTASASLPGA